MRNTNNIVSRGLLGLAALAALGVAAPARADVIYNNFGLGDSYSTGGGYSFYRDIVAAGTFMTGADGYNNLVFEGAFQNIGSTPGVTMRLMGDAGGLPNEGAVLDTSPSLATTLFPGSIVTWTLASSVTLAPNTKYWFAASVTHPSGFNQWQFNNTGARGGAQGFSSTWTPQPGLTSPAFRVSGSVFGGGNTTGGGNGNGGVVPEPSEWAAMGVLGLALGGLVVRKRRTR